MGCQFQISVLIPPFQKLLVKNAIALLRNLRDFTSPVKVQLLQVLHHHTSLSPILAVDSQHTKSTVVYNRPVNAVALKKERIGSEKRSRIREMLFTTSIEVIDILIFWLE